MRAALRSLAPLRVLAVRGVIGFAALKALLVVVAALVNAFAGDGTADLGSPAGAIVLATTLGAVDIRRRGEALLWANLGYPLPLVLAPFALSAVAGEILIAVLAT